MSTDATLQTDERGLGLIALCHRLGAQLGRLLDRADSIIGRLEDLVRRFENLLLRAEELIIKKVAADDQAAWRDYLLAKMEEESSKTERKQKKGGFDDVEKPY